jgi:type VI protein secretion system component VasK
MKDQMKEFLGCYPFNASGGPCDAARFTQMFGPGGTVSKLEGFAGDGSDTAPRAKFGKSLPVGPSFQKMLRSAARIYRGYGANKDGVFELSFEATPAVLVAEQGVKEESLLVKPQMTTLTLDGVSVPYDNAIVSKIAARVPLDDATSAVSVTLESSKKEGWFGKGYAKDELEVGPPPQERGAWSFLQLLGRGRSDAGACCTFDIPVVRKDKKEKLAVIRATFSLTSSPGKPSVLDPKFWKLDPPPEGVSQ